MEEVNFKSLISIIHYCNQEDLEQGNRLEDQIQTFQLGFSDRLAVTNILYSKELLAKIILLLPGSREEHHKELELGLKANRKIEDLLTLKASSNNKLHNKSTAPIKRTTSKATL